MDITLSSCRPKFLCEKILGVVDAETSRKQAALTAKQGANDGLTRMRSMRRQFSFWNVTTSGQSVCTKSDDGSQLDRSSHSLKGLYLGLQEQSNRMIATQGTSTRSLSSNSPTAAKKETDAPPGVEGSSLLMPDSSATTNEISVEEQVLASLVRANQKSNQMRELFDKLDDDGSGTIDLDEFVKAYENLNSGLHREEIETIFREAGMLYSLALLMLREFVLKYRVLLFIPRNYSKRRGRIRRT